MKALYLSREQAKNLAGDLLEYSSMADSSKRSLFKGFEIRFGDTLANEIQAGESFEMTPIPEFTEIDGHE